MSALLKNLHVHFDDDVLSDSATKTTLDDELAGRETISAADTANAALTTTTPPTTTLNYTRWELLELRQSKASKEPPKMFDLSGADDKRKEKIRNVLKNTDILKSMMKNGASEDTVASKGGVTETNEQARTNFQQMISAAVTNAQQQNTEYAATRRRIGSGRIVDSSRENLYPIGMDARYMRNKLFKDDGKTAKNWKSGNDFNWKQLEPPHHDTDNDNTDAKSDEPEWANCGPISKHDIIELHGFDGPEDDDTQKSDGASVSPPVSRSTPSKTGAKKSVKMDDHFNFEEFLKLDLPPSVNCSRDLGAGESRFSQWFGRDKPPHSAKYPGNSYESKSAQQFFDYHQKANQKKMNAPKLRSVDELEADWYPGQAQAQPQPQPQSQSHAKPKEQKAQTMDVNTIRMMLTQLATQSVLQKQRSMTAAQSNFLHGLINKSAENLYQYRLSQNALMKRPDAQLLLHRLVNGEITQFHILQQISNPTLHQRDRETLLAVFAFCNENQQWLLQQQEQQMKHKEQISQQFRQLQMIQMKNGNLPSPTPQELQFHTQQIMQNAINKKQFEDYRNMQNMKTAQQHPKFQSYKGNNYMPNPQNQQYSRYNYKQKQNYGQNGLQFIQSQNKSLWNRQNQTNSIFGGSANSGMRNTNDLLTATMPSFAKFDASTMPNASDKFAIPVEK